MRRSIHGGVFLRNILIDSSAPMIIAMSPASVRERRRLKCAGAFTEAYFCEIS